VAFPNAFSEAFNSRFPSRMSERPLVLILADAQKKSAWGDREKAPNYIAEPTWRSQPAIVKEPEKSTCRRSKVQSHSTLAEALIAAG
jgi:hypothetical protein